MVIVLGRYVGLDMSTAENSFNIYYYIITMGKRKYYKNIEINVPNCTIPI